MKKLMKFNVILTVAIVAFLSVSYSVMAADGDDECPPPRGWAIFSDDDYAPCVISENHFWAARTTWKHYVCPANLVWDNDRYVCDRPAE